jgi:hypothetical protein
MDGDIFRAHITGRPVDCTTLADAVAINLADAVLTGRVTCSAVELEQLADMLARYDCPGEAETVRNRASRARAAQFLTQSVGYERSPHPL